MAFRGVLELTGVWLNAPPIPPDGGFIGIQQLSGVWLTGAESEEEAQGGHFGGPEWGYDLGGKTRKQHLESVTQLLKKEFDLDEKEIKQILKEAEETGISLTDKRLRRIAQAVQTRPLEFQQLITDPDEEALLLIMILAEL